MRINHLYGRVVAIVAVVAALTLIPVATTLAATAATQNSTHNVIANAPIPTHTVALQVVVSNGKVVSETPVAEASSPSSPALPPSITSEFQGGAMASAGMNLVSSQQSIISPNNISYEYGNVGDSWAALKSSAIPYSLFAAIGCESYDGYWSTVNYSWTVYKAGLFGSSYVSGGRGTAEPINAYWTLNFHVAVPSNGTYILSATIEGYNNAPNATGWAYGFPSVSYDYVIA